MEKVVVGYTVEVWWGATARPRAGSQASTVYLGAITTTRVSYRLNFSCGPLTRLA